jgi:hypothetical protein
MSDLYSSDKPCETGTYLMRCGETSEQSILVSVIMLENELCVNDPDIGVYPLDRYHDNLDNPQWKKVVRT